MTAGARKEQARKRPLHLVKPKPRPYAERGELTGLAAIGEARVEAELGRDEEARDSLELVLARCEAARDRLGEAQTLVALGWVDLLSLRADEAVAKLLEEAHRAGVIPAPVQVEFVE